MDARTSNQPLNCPTIRRRSRLVLSGLLFLLLVGLWQSYGAWVVAQLRAHVH